MSHGDDIHHYRLASIQQQKDQTADNIGNNKIKTAEIKVLYDSSLEVQYELVHSRASPLLEPWHILAHHSVP